MDTSPRPPERTQPRLGGFRPVKIGASASSGVTRPAGVPRPASAPVRPMHAESPRKSPSAEPVAKISFPAETEPFRPAAPATASAPASTSARNVGTGKVPPPLPASSPAAAPASTFNAPAAKAAAPVIISQPILFTQAAKPTPPAIPRQSPAGRLDLETSSALATRAGSTTVLLSTAMSQELMAQAAEMLSAEQRRPKGTAGSIQNRRQALKNPFSEPSAIEMMPPATAAMIEEDTFVKVKPPTSFSNETKPQAFPQPLPASKGQQVQAQTPLFPPLVQASTRLGKPAFQRANASLPPAVTRAFVAPAGPNGTVVLPREIAPAAPVPPSAAVTGTIPTVAPSSGAVSAKTFPPLPAMTSGQISTQTIPVKSMRDMSHAFDTAAAISEVLATASGSGSAAATDALRKMEADKHAQNAELAAIAAAEAANAEAVIATEKAAESETTLIFSEEAEDTEPTQKLSDAVAFTDVPVQAVVTVTSPAPVIAAVPAIIPEPEVVKIAAAPAPVAIVQTVPAPAPVVVKQARVLPPTYIMAAPVPAAVVPAPESEQQKSEVNFTETKKESAQSDAMPLPIPVFPPMAEQIQELEH
ncbi:MAG TPA: hypothetical protein VK970_25305, partial [Candidatus Methylacidiphilales bacterium]|nr:hypothetical protein [Candidatus Methylacidiphilales bacterium]